MTTQADRPAASRIHGQENTARPVVLAVAPEASELFGQLGSICEQLDVDIVTAHDADDAGSRARSRAPSIMFMDAGLGASVSQAILKSVRDAANSEVPTVVVQRAHDGPVEASAVATVAHPATDEEILLTAAEIITDQRLAGRARAAAKLASVRRRFRAQLEARLSRLEASLTAGRSGDAEAMGEARMAAHKLHGTAGTLGFPEVSARARDLEGALRQLDEAGESSAAWARVGSAMRGLSSELREEEPTSPSFPSLRRGAFRATMLAVDDDPDFLDQLATVAGRSRVRIIQAASIERARQQLERIDVQGVIVDVSLGRENGMDLVAALRDDRRFRGMPVAMISTEPTFDLRLRAAHLGVSVFLEKPLEQGAFDAALARMIDAAGFSRRRVLVIDDDPQFAEWVAASLDDMGVKVTSLSEPRELIATLAEARPELLLVDRRMPEVNGEDVVRMVRATTRWADIPILLVTAETSDEVRLACYEAGADDYLLKPPLMEELKARVRVHLQRVKLMRDAARADPLTGLLTRAAFSDEASRRLAQARRDGRAVSIAFLDLDRFKSINDTYGHQEGDRVLVRLATLLQSRFRQEDLRCRWGGEEFVVMLFGEDSRITAAVLDRLLAELSGRPHLTAEGHEVTISFSAGVAEIPEDADDMDDAIELADKRMYAAKEGGRSRVVHTD